MKERMFTKEEMERQSRGRVFQKTGGQKMVSECVEEKKMEIRYEVGW